MADAFVRWLLLVVMSALVAGATAYVVYATVELFQHG